MPLEQRRRSVETIENPLKYQTVWDEDRRNLRWSVLRVIDSSDGEEIDTDYLSKDETGCVILYSSRGGRVHFHLPYRGVCGRDSVLIRLISSKSSGFRCEGAVKFGGTAGKDLARRGNNRLLENPRNALFDFSISSVGAEEFVSTLSESGWIVRKNEVAFDYLMSRIETYKSGAEEVVALVSDFRSSLSEKVFQDLDDLGECLQELEDLKLLQMKKASSDEVRAILQERSRLESEDGRYREKGILKEAMTSFSFIRSMVEDLDWSRYQREVSTRYKICTEKEQKRSRGSLKIEVERLREMFPDQMGRVSVDGEDLTLTVPGLEIRLTPEGGMRVKGDPLVLQPYTGEVKTGAKVKGRRRIV